MSRIRSIVRPSLPSRRTPLATAAWSIGALGLFVALIATTTAIGDSTHGFTPSWMPETVGRWSAEIEDAALRHGVDPTLLSIVTLVESRKRAHHFQRTVVRELKLANVRLLRGRVEELAPEPHAGVLAQAMGPPVEVLAWMTPWARPGGWLAIPYSARSAEIVPPAELTLQPPGSYQVPLGGPSRSVLLARKRG